MYRMQSFVAMLLFVSLPSERISSASGCQMRTHVTVNLRGGMTFPRSPKVWEANRVGHREAGSVVQNCTLVFNCPMFITASYSQQYVGCYGDDYPNRAMENETNLGSTMTHGMCANFCRNLSFTFFGAQGSHYCFCCNRADQYSKYGMSSCYNGASCRVASCNYDCSGDTSTKCGGDLANSVYWVCPIGNYGPNCTSLCSMHCIRTDANYGNGCFINGTCPSGCQPGWTGEKCDTDQCTINKGDCQHYCYNNGSFGCSCQNGFILSGDNKSCTDQDECLFNNGNCSQFCNNTEGSYNCTCRNGFILSNDSMSCLDINECQLANNGGCMHNCNNTVGSYMCSCWDGYQGDSSGNYCTDIDECLLNNGGCEHNCSNANGSYKCRCQSGYALKTDGKTCTEINECQLNNGECEQTCKNTPGSFECSCNATYYTLNVDGKSCDEKSSNRSLLGLLALLTLLLIIPLLIVGILYIRKRKTNDDSDDIIGKPTPRALDNGMEPSLSMPSTVTLTTLTSDTPVSEPITEVYANIRSRTPVDKLLPIVVKIGIDPDHLKNEFAMLPKPATGKSNFAEKPELAVKSRFKNIIPYDDNRVLLSEIGGDPLTTFINASFIKGYTEDENIIASHGPTVKTINDFWRMIWEYNVGVIVMVTRCVENGKPKCEQYWPGVGSLNFGDITAHYQSTDEQADRIVRKISVQKTGEPVTRLVTQLQCVDWPDHGVPEHAVSILAIRHTVKRIVGRDQYIVVHCSAGVGRTGTYLAIDYLLSQAENEGHVDVYDHVRNLRQQRMNSVQTLAQYSFIYKAVIEGLTLGETTLTVGAFEGHASKRRTLNPFTKKPFVDTEFLMLKAMLPLPTDILCSDARAEENTSKNTNAAFLPMNASRVFIRQREKGRNDYINAIFIPSFRNKEGYISTQLPLSSTVCDFWNMCMDYECHIIVCLCDHDAAGSTEDVFNFLPKSGEKLQFEKSSVWNLRERATKDNETYEIRSVNVAPYSEAEAAKQGESLYANVQQLPTASVNTVSVIHVFLPADRMLKRAALQQAQIALYRAIGDTSSNKAQRAPIIVVSRDGVADCGQFIAACNLCDMINTQKEVDVFQTVYNIKRAQPHFFTNIDDYEELYHLAQMFIDQTTLYCNQVSASNRCTMWPVE